MEAGSAYCDLELAVEVAAQAEGGEDGRRFNKSIDPHVEGGEHRSQAMEWHDTKYKSQHSSSKLLMSAQGTPRFPMILPSHDRHSVILVLYKRNIQSCGGSHERCIGGQCQAAAPSTNCNLD